MNSASVITRLREHEAELRQAGIAHLSLFGSTARGQNSSASDIDLMAEFAPEPRRTLLTMARLENRLSEILGVRVDLASSKALKPSVRARATREAIRAF